MVRPRRPRPQPYRKALRRTKQRLSAWLVVRPILPIRQKTGEPAVVTQSLRADRPLELVHDLLAVGQVAHISPMDRVAASVAVAHDLHDLGSVRVVVVHLRDDVDPERMEARLRGLDPKPPLMGQQG